MLVQNNFLHKTNCIAADFLIVKINRGKGWIHKIAANVSSDGKYCDVIGDSDSFCPAVFINMNSEKVRKTEQRIWWRKYF